jgi:RND family efflux transporter MFP subunit
MAQPVTVEVSRAELRHSDKARSLAGRVEPARTVDIAFQVSGQLSDLTVDAGTRVEKGDLIAALDPVDFELAVERAQASFDLAKSEYDRALSLTERGVATDARLETNRAQLAQAEVALREAERRLAQATITAPFDAIVARIFLEEVSNVTPAAPIARLQDISEMRVRISLPEEVAAMARAQPDAFRVTASFPAVPGYDATLYLRTFVTDADPTAQTYDVEFVIEGAIDPRLLPGMTANVRVAAAEGAQSRLVVVPVSAIDTTSRSEPSIWLYDEGTGRVSRKTIRLGLPNDDEIVVLEGLSGDELVVSGGWWRLKENETVAVRGL